jgi:hypothetical protein
MGLEKIGKVLAALLQAAILVKPQQAIALCLCIDQNR